MLSEPTFHGCMVGFDIFKQPGSIRLGAEAQFQNKTKQKKMQGVKFSERPVPVSQWPI